MIRVVFILVVAASIIGCKSQKNTPLVMPGDTVSVDGPKEFYFPVTNYIKGQLKEIPARGVNPFKYVTKNGHTDSSWVKIEDLQKEAAPFLEPVIDTLNMSELFAEKKFLDQTINAYTFTYDPVHTLPDGFSLQRWDVYVDPVSNMVKRIYMLKRVADNKTQQLTWVSDHSFKIVTLAIDKNNSTFVESEVLIKWDY